MPLLRLGRWGDARRTVCNPIRPSRAYRSHAIGAGTSSSVGGMHPASAAATYAVAPSTGGTLSETVATDKTAYLRGETVRMSALVKNDGVAVAGASVKFSVTLPSGSTTVISATSGSDGYARAS